MGDCLFRQHHDNRLETLENKIIEYEEFMEQWLVSNSCCYDFNNKNKNKKIYNE